MNTVIRIATRKSALALWQANHVADLLSSAHADVEVTLVPLVTKGDRIIDRPLADIGGKGLFLKELEWALLEDRADIAVHSMKDVPAEMPDGLTIETVLERADARDALLCRDELVLDSLPAGSVVGTSSLRRQCQLRATRPDLEVADLRGNVDTRIAKLQNGEYDAIILAAAGLQRLGLDSYISQILASPDWLPAATQGIIGIQQRANDAQISARLNCLNHLQTMQVCLAERRVAQRLEASCQLPIAVHAELSGDMDVRALVGSPDGRQIIRAHATGAASEGQALGDQVAQELLDNGAQGIISALN